MQEPEAFSNTPSVPPNRPENHFIGQTTLWVSSDDHLRPFAEQLASILFGGLNCHQSSGYALKENVNRGAPLRGEFYIGAETMPFSSFQLENLQIVDSPPDAFTVPSDYTDLYEIIRTGKWPDESQPRMYPSSP